MNWDPGDYPVCLFFPPLELVDSCFSRHGWREERNKWIRGTNNEKSCFRPGSTQSLIPNRLEWYLLGEKEGSLSGLSITCHCKSFCQNFGFSSKYVIRASCWKNYEVCLSLRITSHSLSPVRYWLIRLKA